MALWNVHVEHFLQTQGLSTQLKIRCRSMPGARLVLDRPDCVGIDLDCIGTTGQAKSLRPERDRTEHQPASFVAMVPAVDPAVSS